MKIALRLLLVGMLLSPACGGDSAPAEPCSDPQPATAVQLADFAFEPDCLSVDAGGTIALENVGDAPHTFTAGGTDVDVKVDPGASGEAGFDGVDPGTYSVTCTFHPQMEATLTVG
jgi:plastocyanin